MSLPPDFERTGRSFVVDAREQGRRLGETLADRIGWVSRLRLRRLVRDGLVQVSGRPADWGRRLDAGEIVDVRSGLAIPTAMRPEPIALRIVYEDQDIAAVDKPAGMLVHPTLGVKTGTLANALAHYLNPELAAGRMDAPVVRPAFINRLDRETSGLVVVAKHADAARVLYAEFRARRVKKRYRAVLSGHVREDEMTIRAPIGRVSESKPQWNTAPKGKPALTSLTVLERRDRHTLVRLDPETGRTNQLRIHCAAVGHPILGDIVYGAPAAERLLLHADSLELRRPSDGAALTLTAEIPAEFDLKG